eukprot:747271-Pleurochrysis_carterae.AAC.1
MHARRAALAGARGLDVACVCAARCAGLLSDGADVPLLHGGARGHAHEHMLARARARAHARAHTPIARADALTH